jgi:hypothetical protein
MPANIARTIHRHTARDIAREWFAARREAGHIRHSTTEVLRAMQLAVVRAGCSMRDDCVLSADDCTTVTKLTYWLRANALRD